MKRLWNMVSFLAVVNLLAMALFIGWLWQTKRLNIDRLRAMHDTLVMTAEEQAEQDARDAADAMAADEAAAEAERTENPPLPSGIAVRYHDDLMMRDAQVMRRWQDEKELLVRQLEDTRRQLEVERAAFNAERDAWRTATQDERQQLIDENLTKAVTLLSSIPAKQAKDVLINLVDRGDQSTAVRYLDAMDQRAASKILREFKSDAENQLATELLEQLRINGLDAVAMESLSDESTADNPARAPGPTQE